MCAMWLVLQLAVVLLYWDVPPLNPVPKMHTAMHRVREEDEWPLVSSQGEDDTPGSGSYSMVISDQTDMRLSEDLGLSEPEAPSAPDGPHSLDDPFKNFSASQGAFAKVVLI